MKVNLLLLLLCLIPLTFTGCADTGFYRKVPVSRQGGWSEFRYRVLEAPEWWAPDINPLFFPGDSENLWDPMERKLLTEQLHRENIRLITENPGYGLYEELTLDWNRQ